MPTIAPSERCKLAAILSADAVAYSRLMADNAAATLRALNARRELFKHHVRAFGGRVVDTAGDSVLADFGSAVDAVECATQVQADVQRSNADLGDDRKMEFRIGVNLGDVIEDKGAIYGDGVNVAARLQSLAEPGGIVVSQSVYQAVGARLPIDYEDQGEHRVKNIAEPVRAYAAQLRAGAPGSAVLRHDNWRSRRRIRHAVGWTVGALALVMIAGAMFQLARDPAGVSPAQFPMDRTETRPAIAVLPFENLSDSPAQQYFAHGVTDDLITGLTKLSGVLVIARESTFNYRGDDVDTRVAAQHLNVRYVLKGSVGRASNTVRINAQLVDAHTGAHVWAERFEGAMTDLFVLQDRITSSVVSGLAIRLTEDERARLSRGDAVDLTAYEHFLQGRERFFRYARDDSQAAKALYEKAIATDSEFAAAHAMLAWAHVFDYMNGWSEDPARSLQQAHTFADRAIALNRNLPVAYFVKGLAYREAGEYIKAMVEARRALEYDPNYANGIVLLATLIYYAGEPAESLQLLQQAVRLNPHHPTNYDFHIGQAYYTLSRYDEAIKAFEAGLERKPTSQRLHVWLAASYAQAGNMQGAQWEADQVLLLDPEFTVERMRQAVPFKNLADTERLLTGLRKAGLPG